ncbi:MAG: hypothetical protein RL557_641 [archaeon]|jgi:hypothetical protein
MNVIKIVIQIYLRSSFVIHRLKKLKTFKGIQKTVKGSPEILKFAGN